MHILEFLCVIYATGSVLAKNGLPLMCICGRIHVEVRIFRRLHNLQSRLLVALVGYKTAAEGRHRKGLLLEVEGARNVAEIGALWFRQFR